jgi:NAD(P)-dependent dehydrogenase (short-subunit alcohol dehydrogenase family)
LAAMSEGKLVGGVALITGGGGEIGAAIARRFAREGAKVAVADVDFAKAETVAHECADLGSEAVGVAMDVSSEASVEAGVKKAADAFTKLTILVNVAATVTADGTVETIGLADWNRALAINLTGAFLSCKFAVPEIRKAGGGAIVNIASQLGVVAAANAAAYCASKGAVISLTRAMAIDHGPEGIRVNCVCPGPTDTPLLDPYFGGAPDPAAERRAY